MDTLKVVLQLFFDLIRRIVCSYLAACLIVFVLFSSGCGSKYPQETNSTSDSTEIKPPSLEIKYKKLTEAESIQKVKDMLYQSKKTIPMQMHYSKTIMNRVACTQYDIDAGIRCSEPVAGAPYGYKNVPQQSWECCELKNFPLYNAQGRWTAEYSEPEDRWMIKFEFELEDVKKGYEWLVGDKNGEVTDKGEVK